MVRGREGERGRKRERVRTGEREKEGERERVRKGERERRERYVENGCLIFIFKRNDGCLGTFYLLSIYIHAIFYFPILPTVT